MGDRPGRERRERYRFDLRDRFARHRRARHGTRRGWDLLGWRMARRVRTIHRRGRDRCRGHRYRLAERAEPHQHHHRQDDDRRGARELEKRDDPERHASLVDRPSIAHNHRRSADLPSAGLRPDSFHRFGRFPLGRIDEIQPTVTGVRVEAPRAGMIAVVPSCDPISLQAHWSLYRKAYAPLASLHDTAWAESADVTAY
jgi:hypothetical protein